MNKEEKRKYEAFQYWIQTNTEKGVTTIPDTLCLFVVNLINKLQKENEELNKNYNFLIDKIIYLMAETINNHDIDEDVCKQMGRKQNCNEFEDTEKCKECIKQYFNNKANGGKN